MSTKRHFQGTGKSYKGSGAITIAALTPEASADYDITDANAAVGDVICVSLLEADMEASLVVAAAWVATAGTISVRILNHTANGGANLTGGAATVHYVIIN